MSSVLGRPTKFEQSMVIAVKYMAYSGLTDVQMAEELGINIDTFYDWQNKFPAFSEAIKEGKSLPDEAVQSALFRRATGYTHKVQKALVVSQGRGEPSEVEIVEVNESLAPDPTSMIFWLKNRRPDRWREKQDVEHSGQVSITIGNEFKGV